MAAAAFQNSNPNTQVHIKTLSASFLLMFCWPKSHGKSQSQTQDHCGREITENSEIPDVNIHRASNVTVH